MSQNKMAETKIQVWNKNIRNKWNNLEKKNIKAVTFLLAFNKKGKFPFLSRDF